MKNPYLLSSERLGFRNWRQSDLSEFAKINADPNVMEHFPKTLSEEETADFIDRLIKHYDKHGFNYFATEVIATGELIGFIGLAFQQYESKFTPAIDIGWRLKKSAWGKGYATEGAKRCLDLGFDKLKLDKIISTCPSTNTRSEKVMQKIGMTKIGEFDHPNLKEHRELKRCFCYGIERSKTNDW